jgi:filamentous hemagglutinin family protein
MDAVSSARTVLLSLRRLLYFSGLLLSMLPTISQAQITLDGSLGPREALRGPNYAISDSVGQIRGPNLFHSFGQFNLSQGESATFTGPDTITHILGRVTGGNPSNIDGTIRSQIPGANLYLLNPSGVLIGPHASLDMSGAFHVSTADVIRLADGGAFFAHPAAPSVLTVAPPAAFGFLSPAPAKITVQGSTLEAPTGKSLSLVGGDVEVTGGTLITRSGRLTLVSVGEPGEVPFDHAVQAPALSLGSVQRLGTISLSHGAILGAGGNPGGTVIIRGGRLVMTDNAEIRANAAGSTDGGSRVIDVQVAESVVIDGSSISAPNLGAEQARDVAITAGGALTVTNEGSINTVNPGSAGGNIHIDVGRLTLTGGGRITSGTLDGTGQGGAITVRARDEVTIAGVSSSHPDLPSRLQAFSDSGRAGDIFVSAPSVVLDGGAIATQVGREGGAITVQGVGRLHVTGGGFVQSFALSGGQAGGVTITASDTVSITSGGFISSSAQSGGKPGSTVVKASALLIDGGTLGTFASPGLEATAGDVTVEVATLSLTGGGQIVSATAGAGPGGTITVAASESIAISGRSSLRPSQIVSSTIGSGNGGRVIVSTPSLTIDGGQIFADALQGAGSAGDVVLKDIGTLTLTNGAQVTSEAFPESTGNAGNVTLEVGTVVVTGGSFLSTTTSGLGKGGTLTIKAREAVSIAGPAASSDIDTTIVSAATLGSGAGGQIVIAAPVLRMAGGVITALTGVPETGPPATGAAGNVSVEVDRLSLAGGALIDSRTTSEGRGGSVQVTVRESAVLTGNSGLTTISRGSGAGGNVALHAHALTLSDGASLSAESTGMGNAGNITITTQDSFVSTQGRIVTRAARTDGGNIQITAPTLVRLRDSAITAEVGGGSTTVGGNITIDPQFVLLQNSQIVANAFEGRGGNISIQAQQVFLADPASIVSATSRLGINGAVAIQAPVTNISGAVAPLPQAFAQPVELLRSRCVERLREGTVSRFVVGGRDGVPLEPGTLLLSPLQRVGQEGGVQEDERESHNSEAQHGRAWYAQAPAPGELEVECARWRGQPGTAVTPKQLR